MLAFQASGHQHVQVGEAFGKELRFGHHKGSRNGHQESCYETG
jgi:hypothetical protein